MIRINLAPEYIPESNPNSLYIALGFMLICAGGTFYAPVWYADQIIADNAIIRAKTEEKKGQLNKLKLDIEKVKMLQTKLADVKNRAQRIKVLGIDRKQPILFLDKMQAVHLDRMWLSSLEMSQDKEKSVINIAGKSFDHSIVAEYSKRIKTEFQNSGTESSNGFQDYVPQFLNNPEDTGGAEEQLENETTSTSKKVRIKSSQSAVTPILLKNLVLKKSQNETGQKINLNSFEIDLETNIQLD